MTGKIRPERLPRNTVLRSGSASAEADHPSVLLRERHQLRDHHRPELLGQVVDLVVGHGHEAPVLLPGQVVERLDPLDLAVEVLEVERPDRDAHPLADQLGAAGEPLRHRNVLLVTSALVHQQILRLGEPGPLDAAGRSSAGCAAS